MVSELSLNLPTDIERIIVLFNSQISYPYKGRLICLGIPLSNTFLAKIFYFFSALVRFRKIVKKEKPDYVISFVRPANIINVLSGARAVLRVDSFLSSLPGAVYKILTKIFYKKAFKVICVSRASAKDMVDNFGVKKEKIKVIYNPLNIKEIQKKNSEPLESEHQIIFEKPVIVNVGSLTKGKNHPSLIRVFSEVKKLIKEAQLVILGIGETEAELRALIKNLQLNESVHLLGWQDNPFKFLAKAKVFVSTSLREGLPYGILEAMACGLPTISADCQSGPKEILLPESGGVFGILTPAGDERRIKEATIKVLSDNNLAADLSKKSLQRANDFDIKNIIKHWDFLYD